jgi:hypothetical protein
MDIAVDLPAILRATGTLGWDPEDIARHLFADGSLSGGIEDLDWEGVERAMAFRLIAHGILSVDNPSVWQRVLDRLGMLPELVWLESVTFIDSQALRQKLEQLPHWGRAKIADEHEASRFVSGYWNMGTSI